MKGRERMGDGALGRWGGGAVDAGRAVRPGRRVRFARSAEAVLSGTVNTIESER